MVEEQKLLWASAAYSAALLAPALILLRVDARLVTGTNPGMKVAKFAVSIVVFNLTVIWLLQQLAGPEESGQWVGWVVAVAMWIEMTAIFVQAARGVPSHYNSSTPFNAAIFALMAVAIVCNTLAMAWLCLLFFGPHPQLPVAVLWGVRLGLILFLLASAQGFLMVGNRGHTVGTPDGGPGLPLVRWSTIAGDLRVAHFAGMHGIQLLPMLGYWCSRADRSAGLPVVAVVFLVLAGLFFGTLHQAYARRPLFRITAGGTGALTATPEAEDRAG